MMLALENPSTGGIEIAMLLDEPPSRQYMPGGMGGQPYRPNGPLARAIRDADMSGYAWLTLVYRGDDARSWGSKRVKVMSGGRLFYPLRTRLGNETGELKELRFETVCPSLYGPVYGRPTTLNYKVIQDAEMTLDPDLETDLGKKHALLGYREKKDDEAPKEVSELGKYIHTDLWCRVVWLNQAGYGETWFLQDVSGFTGYRFELTEHQRRPFVREVLKRLGWVRDPATSVQDFHETAKRQCRGHMLNVGHSLNAMACLLNESREVSRMYPPQVLGRRSSLTRPQPVPDVEDVDSQVQEVPVTRGPPAKARSNYNNPKRAKLVEDEATALAAAHAYDENEMEELEELTDDNLQIVEDGGKRTQSDSDDGNMADDGEEFVFDG